MGRPVWLVSLLICAAAAFAVGYGRLLPMPDISLRPAAYAGAVPHVGRELRLVYLGSSRCGASNFPELPRWVEDAKLQLAAFAARSGLGFSSSGASVDVRPAEGLKHLAKFGVFDEVWAGRGYMGLAAERYVSHVMIGPPATPQLLVTIRLTRQLPSGYDVGSEQLLVRKTGLVEIRRWVRYGAPVVLPSPRE